MRIHAICGCTCGRIFARAVSFDREVRTEGFECPSCGTFGPELIRTFAAANTAHFRRVVSDARRAEPYIPRWAVDQARFERDNSDPFGDLS